MGRFGNDNDNDLDGYEAWVAGEFTNYDFIEPDEGELGDDEFDESDSDNDEYDDASEGNDSDDNSDEKGEKYGADETGAGEGGNEEEYFNEKKASSQGNPDGDTDNDAYEGKYWGLHIERENKIAKPWINWSLTM